MNRDVGIEETIVANEGLIVKKGLKKAYGALQKLPYWVRAYKNQACRRAENSLLMNFPTARRRHGCRPSVNLVFAGPLRTTYQEPCGEHKTAAHDHLENGEPEGKVKVVEADERNSNELYTDDNKCQVERCL